MSEVTRTARWVNAAGRRAPLIVVGGLALPLIAIVVGGVVPSGLGMAHASGALVLSVGMVAFGCACFVRDGGRVITPLGVYQLAGAVFAGASPLLASRAGESLHPRAVMVLVAVHLTNVAVYWLVGAWTRERSTTMEPPDGFAPVPGAALSCVLAGALLVAAALTAIAHEVPASGLPARSAYVGVLLVCAPAVIALAGRRRWRTVLLLPAALSLAIYVGYFFSGFGRLIVATLALSVVLIGNMASPRAWHKPVILASLIPALLIGGMAGLGRNPGDEQVTAGVPEVLLQARGLDSVFEPLNTFASVVDLDESDSSLAFPRQHGRTFVDALFLWVPRSLWPSKPDGFGLRLTEVFLPSQLAFGHTMAALSWGEWYVNFGWLGVVMSAPAAAFALTLLRRWQRRLLGMSRMTALDIGNVAAFAVLTAGLADYVWMGSFTYVSRGGLAVGVITVARGVLWMVRRSRTDRAGSYVQVPHPPQSQRLVGRFLGSRGALRQQA